MNVKLHQDSRNQPFHLQFGSVNDFPADSHFGFDLTRVIEQPGEVDCTALSLTKVCASQTKREYDVVDLWAKTPHGASGADPKATAKALVDNGLKIVPTGDVDKQWVSYFQAELGTMSYADNIRSAMIVAQSSCTVASYWDINWTSVAPGGIMPMPTKPVSAHDYEILDWITKDNVVYFIIDAHLGYTTLMPAEVLNAALHEYGTEAIMPSTQAIQDKQKRTYLQALLDLCINTYLAMVRLKMLISGKIWKQ